jgi:hypothetical protein
MKKASISLLILVFASFTTQMSQQFRKITNTENTDNHHRRIFEKEIKLNADGLFRKVKILNMREFM